MDEKWLAIKGFEGLYEVSDLGRVRSLPRHIRSKKYKGKVLAGVVGGNGYPAVVLQKDGQKRRAAVHRLVLETFVGDCPEGMCARHLDGDKKNARLTNLAWGTPLENSADQVRHGTAPRGVTHPNAILEDGDIKEIFSLADLGVSQTEIARQFGVCSPHINNILRRRAWRHVGA